MNNKLTVSQIVEKMQLKTMSSIYEDKAVETGYCCDMLSWVISHLTSNACWFTILSSMNVIAVASLSDCPIVVITESSGDIDQDVIQRAITEQICLCTTEMDSFHAAKDLARLIEEES